jgi:hypothetical protein
MKTYDKNVEIHVFLTSVLAGSEWSASRPCRFNLRGKEPGYLLYRRLGGLQNGLDDMEEVLGLTETWGPHKLLSNAYIVPFPLGKAAGSCS